MSVVLIFIHTVAAVLLIVVILMQSGRGGGLTEGFAPAESLFGAKTNQFMVRATTTMALLFLVTSLSLAYLSSRRAASLISDTVEEAATGDQTLTGEVPPESQEEGAVAPAVTEPVAVEPNQALPAVAGPADSGQATEVQTPAEGVPEAAVESAPEAEDN